MPSPSASTAGHTETFAVSSAIVTARISSAIVTCRHEVDGPVRFLRSNLIDGIKEMHVRFTPEGRGATVAVPA